MRFNSKIIQNVLDGADYLDKNYPRWYTKIDVTDLNMGIGDCCICGQLFMDQFNEEKFEDGFEYWVSTYSIQEAEELGFTIGCNDPILMLIGMDKVSEFLAMLWIHQIQLRLTLVRDD